MPDRIALDAGWLSVDTGGVVLESGALGDQVFGWTPHQLRGKSMTSILHPDDHGRFEAAAAQARDEGWEAATQVRVRERSGAWARAEVTVRAVGGGIVVTDLVDVSARYTSTEGLDVLAEIKRLVDRAVDLDAAWETALAHLAQLAGFKSWARWVSADTVLTADGLGGDLTCPADSTVEANEANEASPSLERHPRVGNWIRVPAEPHQSTSDLLRRAVETAIDTDSGGWLHDLLQADPLTAPAALVVPVTSRDETVAVVELSGQEQLRDDVAIAMVIEVAGQLGDALERRRVDDHLRAERQRFELAFERAAIGMMLVGVDGTILRANESTCAFFGRSADELCGLDLESVTHPDDLHLDDAQRTQLLVGDRDTYTIEKRFLRPGERSAWGQLSASLVRTDHGGPHHLVMQIQDIDRQRTAQAALERTIALFAAAFDGAATGMVLVGLDGDDRSLIAASNSRFRQLASSLGHQRPIDKFDEFSTEADQWLHRIGTLDAGDTSDTFVREQAVSGPVNERWVRLSASPVRASENAGRFVIVHVEDVTEERRAQSELAYNALHDSLTGLPNRELISERIRHAQERSERTGAHLGVLFIDLDHFKDVNDTLGHHAGDQLLREVARRFATNIRPSDTAARLGGDEFVILCEDLSTDPDEAEAEVSVVASRLHAALEGGIEFEQGEGWVTASIGTQVVRGGSHPVATLLGNADVAMYRAKANGRSRTEVFDAAMRKAATERVQLAAKLRRALGREQLWVAYQPIVRLSDGHLVAAEALLRWDHPELGPVPPDRFIDIAEESDMIVALGEFVIESVCQAVADHPELSYVTMNVSARQLSQSRFADTLLDTMSRHQLSPDRLAIELTENVLMDVGGSSLRQLAELRDAGLKIGVDDFGTGYASLTYLKRLPVTFVKIDKSFVDGIIDDDDDRTIVQGTIGLAHSLGLSLVAEGVEAAEQGVVLQELGCELGQGYHFGRPAPLDELLPGD